jgi:hypothetical protein
MLENQFSEGLKNYEVPPYKEPKMKAIAVIISFFHLIFVCLPVFVFLYVIVEVFFFIRDSHRLIKKTIKNEKTKFKSKPTERLS